MLAFFDYIFYRIYSFYSKNKKEDTPLISTLNFVSALQFSILVAIGLLIEHVTKSPFFQINKTVSWTIFIIVIVGLYLLNALRFVRRKYYLKVVERYSDSPYNKKIKLWMIFIQPPLIIVLAFLFFWR